MLLFCPFPNFSTAIAECKTALPADIRLLADLTLRERERWPSSLKPIHSKFWDLVFSRGTWPSLELNLLYFLSLPSLFVIIVKLTMSTQGCRHCRYCSTYLQSWHRWAAAICHKMCCNNTIIPRLSAWSEWNPPQYLSVRGQAPESALNLTVRILNA